MYSSNFMNSSIYNRVHQIPPLVTIRSNLNPFHILCIRFPIIHFNIICPSTNVSHVTSFPSIFHTKTLLVYILFPQRATHPTHLILPGVIARKYMVRKTIRASPHNPPFSRPLLISSTQVEINSSEPFLEKLQLVYFR
jgi:hypothetical protein